VNRHAIGSWLSGPSAATPPAAANPAARPAASAPASSSGAPDSARSPVVAGFGRRLAAIGVDWALCLAISAGLRGGDSWATLGVFALENLLLVGTLGFTVGHRLLGLRVVSLRSGRPTAPAVLVRTALLCLAVPALISGADGRGLHDRAAGTSVVRA
jgi:uncharacterized RDD family membrane protein YckC